MECGLNCEEAMEWVTYCWPTVKITCHSHPVCHAVKSYVVIGILKTDWILRRGPNLFFKCLFIFIINWGLFTEEKIHVISPTLRNDNNKSSRETTRAVVDTLSSTVSRHLQFFNLWHAILSLSIENSHLRDQNYCRDQGASIFDRQVSLGVRQILPVHFLSNDI